jgi:hypothetical protein
MCKTNNVDTIEELGDDILDTAREITNADISQVIEVYDEYIKTQIKINRNKMLNWIVKTINEQNSIDA